MICDWDRVAGRALSSLIGQARDLLGVSDVDLEVMCNMEKEETIDQWMQRGSTLRSTYTMFISPGRKIT